MAGSGGDFPTPVPGAPFPYLSVAQLALELIPEIGQGLPRDAVTMEAIAALQQAFIVGNSPDQHVRALEIYAQELYAIMKGGGVTSSSDPATRAALNAAFLHAGISLEALGYTPQQTFQVLTYLINKNVSGAPGELIHLIQAPLGVPIPYTQTWSWRKYYGTPIVIPATSVQVNQYGNCKAGYILNTITGWCDLVSAPQPTPPVSTFPPGTSPFAQPPATSPTPPISTQPTPPVTPPPSTGGTPPPTQIPPSAPQPPPPSVTPPNQSQPSPSNQPPQTIITVPQPDGTVAQYILQDLTPITAQPPPPVVPPPPTTTIPPPTTTTTIPPPPPTTTIPPPPPTTTIPPPPPPSPPPPTSTPDPNGDTITNSLCNQMSQNAAALVAAIGNLGLQLAPGTETDPNCCANVVAAIGAVASSLAEISNAVSVQIDLTPVATQLNAIGNLLFAWVSAAKTPPADLTPVVLAIDTVAKAIDDLPPFDQGNLKSIADSQATAALQGDVPPEILQQLIADGVIPPEYSGLLQGSPWSHVLSVIHATRERLSKVNWWQDASNAIRAAAYWSTPNPGASPPPSFNEPGFTEKGMGDGITAAVQALLQAGFDGAGDLFGPFVTAFLKAHNAQIATMRNVKPGDEQAGAVDLLTEATAFGVGAHYAAVLGETIFPTKTLGLPQLAALLALLSGYEEISKGLIGTEINALVQTPHRYAINAQARSILPSLSNAQFLYARGLISDTDRDSLVAWNGLHPEYADVEQAGAYRGLNPRQMVRLIETNIFTQSEVADELTFSGMRVESQARMLRAAPYLATATYRAQLHESLNAAFVAGIGTETDYTNAIDAAESNTDRDSLIIERARIQKQIAAVKALETEYSILFAAGLIDDATYRADLEGIGLQPDRVNLLAAVSEAKANAVLAREMAAAERTLIRQTVTVERKAALANFKAGNTDLAGYVTALLLTGLTPAQAAAWGDLATLQIVGQPQRVFGVLVSKSQAQTLRERVSALDDQRKKLLITGAAFVTALQALGIPAVNINALRAAADAEITPAKSATLIPVSTS